MGVGWGGVTPIYKLFDWVCAALKGMVFGAVLV